MCGSVRDEVEDMMEVINVVLYLNLNCKDVKLLRLELSDFFV